MFKSRTILNLRKIEITGLNRIDFNFNKILKIHKKKFYRKEQVSRRLKKLNICIYY